MLKLGVEVRVCDGHWRAWLTRVLLVLGDTTLEKGIEVVPMHDTTGHPDTECI